jgi:D-tyrosyl-tRNA(Tyr) deacylase
MRAVIQRVNRAEVVVNGASTGLIERGLLVFIGIHKSDTKDDLEWMAGKILQVRIFPDAEGKMNRSIKDVDGGILVVSQFTLFGNLKKGTRPSFNRAADPEMATAIYEELVKQLSFALGKPVSTGRFGEHMDILCDQDGPVTLILDSNERDF